MRAAVMARRGVRGACAMRGGCDVVWRSGARAGMRAIGAHAGANGVGLDDEVGRRRARAVELLVFLRVMRRVCPRLRRR